MPKELAVTGLGNEIVYATTDGKGLITGKKEVITDQAIDAVFTHLKTRFERENAGGKAFGRNYSDQGRLLYLPPGVDVIRVGNEEK